MNLLFLFFIFISGVSISKVVTLNNKKLTYPLAPALSMIFPNILLYTSHLLNIEFNRQWFLTTWFITIFSLCLFFRKSFIQDYSNLFNFISKQNKLQKILSLVFIIGVITFSLRVFTAEMWDGDGVSFYLYRTLDWYQKSALEYNPETLIFKQTWLNYPLYHSLTMLSMSYLVSEVSLIYTANIMDIVSVWGLIFTSLYFLTLFVSKNNIKPWQIILFIICLVFGCREHIGNARSGYTELIMSYYILLFSCLLTDYLKTKNVSLLFYGIIPLSIMSITRAEGLYRGIIIITSFIMLYPKVLLRFRTLIPFLGTILIIKFDKFANTYSGTKNQFFDYLDLSPERVMYKLTYLPELFIHYYQSAYINPVKMNIILTSLLFPVAIIYLYKQEKNKTYLSFAIIFVGSTIFHLLPFLIVNNIIDPSHENPISFVDISFSRYSFQVLPLLNSLISLFIIFHICPKIKELNFLNRFKQRN